MKDLLLAGLTAVAFGLLYQVSRRALLLSGIIGAVSWAVASLVHRIPGSGLLMDFIGALVVGTLGEIAATWEREPSPVFVVPAIVVYVPGELAYQSMVSFLRGHFPAGLQSGLTALLAAGAISLGLALSAAFIRPLLRRGT